MLRWFASLLRAGLRANFPGHWNPWVAVVVLTLGGEALIACTPINATPRPPSFIPATSTCVFDCDGGPSIPPTRAPSRATPPTAAIVATPGATARADGTAPAPLQARQVATITAFLAAYNDGRLADAVALFADGPLAQYADCDLGQGRQVEARGRAAIAQLIAARIADHDHLTLGRLEPAPPPSNALAVVYERRESDTLRALGRPDGVRPFYAAKAILQDDGARIDTLVSSCD